MLLFFLYGAAAVMVLMLLAWVSYLLTRVGSLIDLFWALGFVVLMLLYYLFSDRDSVAGFYMLILGLVWALRLFVYLFFYRNVASVEDPRYTELSSTWKIKKSLGFLTNYLMQGFLMLVISLPFMVTFSTSIHFDLFFWLGICLSLVGVVNEAIADLQLIRFKKNKVEHKMNVCRLGWWKFSRHPNYFFDWLTWLGFSIIALSHPLGWIALLSPLALLFVFLGVTINITEQHALISRGEAYWQYQQTTSKFFPWLTSEVE